jgi:hypothetical protein
MFLTAIHLRREPLAGSDPQLSRGRHALGIALLFLSRAQRVGVTFGIENAVLGAGIDPRNGRRQPSLQPNFANECGRILIQRAGAAKPTK